MGYVAVEFADASACVNNFFWHRTHCLHPEKIDVVAQCELVFGEDKIESFIHETHFLIMQVTRESEGGWFN